MEQIAILLSQKPSILFYIFFSYLPKASALTNNEIKNMKNLVNDIKGHHFHLGECKNDFNTTTGTTFLYDGSKALGARGSLHKGLKDDLRATHYKLGYLPEQNQTTHQSSFVPVDIGQKAIHDPNLRINHFDFNSMNKKFDEKTIYMCDYTKKAVEDY